MDIGGADPGESDERGNDEERCGEKYKAVRHDISEHAHDSAAAKLPADWKR